MNPSPVLYPASSYLGVPLPLRNLLISVFLIILVAMIAVTVNASMQQNIWDTWPDYSQNPWAVATLWDAYFGFTIFWIWVAVRENSWASRISWLILIYGLGNMATAAYVLIQLFRLKPNQPLISILTPKRAANPLGVV